MIYFVINSWLLVGSTHMETSCAITTNIESNFVAKASNSIAKATKLNASMTSSTDKQTILQNSTVNRTISSYCKGTKVYCQKDVAIYICI